MLTKTCRARTIALCLVIAVPLFAGCGRAPDAAGDRDRESGVPVEVALATREAIVASWTGTAALEPAREAQVAAKTGGVLLELLTEEGRRVKAGQVLARLDAERARLELARAEANLKRLENNFARAEDLYQRRLISTEAFEQVRTDLATQRAAHELARLELSYTEVTAPIDGVISERRVKEGNLIQPNQVLFRIDDFDPLLAVLNVPERELAIMRAGLPVRMVVDALPGQVFEGKVARVSPVVEAGTGTFRVTAEFRDPAGRLKSGMFGRIEIVYDTRSDALTIPREALAEEDGQTYVFVVERGIPVDVRPAATGQGRSRRGRDAEAETPRSPTTIARRRNVVTGFAHGGRVEVRDGLADGDRVVTVGRASLRDGLAVQVLEAAP
jgi:membrane fusion protein (multidrug efflux system)